MTIGNFRRQKQASLEGEFFQRLDSEILSREAFDGVAVRIKLKLFYHNAELLKHFHRADSDYADRKSR